MDVTCEQCKAEYDFDDTLLGDKGTTVKCSQCGHVFRVLPPRREPTRSALKVRFAHDGHIEAVGSLRELQQRIQAGDVGVDDELGRDGFTFRKLRDVPELRNFFGRGTTSGSSAHPAPGVAVEKVSQRPDARPKRTVIGLGPNAHDVPTSPRMQGLGPGGLAAQALAPTQPGSHAPKATVQGRAPISTAPTAPSQPAPREPPGRRVPISSAPTPSGTAPTMPASSPLYGGPASLPPAATVPETSQRAPGSAGPGMLRVPDSYAPEQRAAEPRRGNSGDSIGPGALKAAVRPRTAASVPPGAGGRKVRLRMEDDESPPERASGGSSKVLLAFGVFALLGVGGFVASRRFAGNADEVAPTPSPTGAPELTADAALAEAAPLAEAPAADAAPIPEPAPSPPAAAPEPTRAPAAAAPPTAETDKPGAAKPAPSSARGEKEAEPPAASSGREPKDYTGWVARGQQLFSRGDMTGARMAFEAAVALSGTGSEANSGLGSVLLALGQMREAVPYLSRAAANGFAEASVGLGDAYRKLGQPEAAVEAYETYLARMPRGSRANYVKLQLEGLGKAPPGREASEPPPRAEPSPRPSSEYRPAGELTEPPPAAPEAREPAPGESQP